MLYNSKKSHIRLAFLLSFINETTDAQRRMIDLQSLKQSHDLITDLSDTKEAHFFLAISV